MFNEVWVSGRFPTSWKEATIIPIPKPGKDNTDPSNYRPIALTCCLCKTLERMINTRLIWFLESNGLISLIFAALRLALGALRTSPVESLYVEANEAPLSLRREKLALQYYTKLQSCPSNPAFECTIDPKYKELFA